MLPILFPLLSLTVKTKRRVNIDKTTFFPRKNMQSYDIY